MLSCMIKKYSDLILIFQFKPLISEQLIKPNVLVIINVRH